ncbi:MAG: hypothetical protein K9N51_02200 [Candidatus Pacebacteria bacterium]|nr:hypothetical protein [Candidatus Paceibacterota bacterium]
MAPEEKVEQENTEQHQPQEHLDPEQELLEYEEILEEYRRRQMVEHLTGPMISLAVHVVVIIACALLLAGREIQETSAVEFDVKEMQVKPLDPETLDDLEDIEEEIINEAVPPVERPEVNVEDVTVETTDDLSPEMASANLDINVDTALQTSTTSPLKLTGLMASRSDENRDEARREFGGETATERSVLKALLWLKNNQSPDGHWSPQHPEAMTGLGLLAFLAHGETPQSKQFGETVEKAMTYLINKAMKQDMVGGRAYTHGIVAYALSECYALTQLPIVKPAMEKAIRRIVKGQQPETGGYNYRYASYPATKRWDLSVSVWQIQAMKAASYAGAEVQGLDQALKKSVEFLKNVCYKDGKFGYSSPGSGSGAMQGAGTLALQLLGEGDSREARAGVENVSSNYKVVWNDEAQYHLHRHPSYDWYYQTQGVFHGGKRYWRDWNRQFAPVLRDNQHTDGHWECPGDNSKIGKLDPFYSTALNCLTLQVYYRYLPTYRQPDKMAQREDDVFGTVDEQDLDLEIR